MAQNEKQKRAHEQRVANTSAEREEWGKQRKKGGGADLVSSVMMAREARNNARHKKEGLRRGGGSGMYLYNCTIGVAWSGFVSDQSRTSGKNKKRTDRATCVSFDLCAQSSNEMACMEWTLRKERKKRERGKKETGMDDDGIKHVCKDKSVGVLEQGSEKIVNVVWWWHTVVNADARRPRMQ